jgi:hypothetical protein
MTKVSQRLRSVFKAGPQKAMRKWPSIKGVKDWLAAKPRDEDFKKWYLWWIPPRRWAFVIILALALAVLLARGLYARLVLDARFDDPDKFEQTYNLNGFFPLAEDAIKIESNLFGLDANKRLRTRAELRQWHGRTKADSIHKLGQYLKFSPLTLWSSDPAITIATLPGEPNLQSSLQTLAKLGLVRFQPVSWTVGAVYSFDLEMEVYRDQYSIGRYIETFHLRADATVEKVAFYVAVFLVGVAILFIWDLTSVSFDYRWRQYFKAMAGVLTQALSSLKYPLALTLDLPGLPSVIKDILDNLVEKIVEQLIEKLEQLIAESDDVEASELRDDALNLRQKISAHAALAIETEEQLLAWKSSLQENIAHTERLQKRVEQLSRRHFRQFKAPLHRDALRAAVEQANKTLSDTFIRLKETISELNARRQAKRKRHDEVKSRRILEIIHTLNGFLSQPQIKEDMEQLGQTFPLESSPDQLFKTRPVFAHGENDYFGGKLQLIYPGFAFGVRISDDNDDEPIWLAIRKEKDEYTIAQATPDQKRNITLGSVTLPTADYYGKEVKIRYTIKTTPENARTEKDSPQFKIKQWNLEFIDPAPNPEPLFMEEPMPKSLRK